MNVDYENDVLGALDFEHEIPCEAFGLRCACGFTHHAADWYATKVCGCSKYVCTEAIRRLEAEEKQRREAWDPKPGRCPDCKTYMWGTVKRVVPISRGARDSLKAK